MKTKGSFFCLLTGLLTILATGCIGLKWCAYERAWDDFRCDRRVGVFVNLRLDTVSGGKDARGLLATACEGNGLQAADGNSTAKTYQSALAYLHSRKVSEVIFEGRATAHGALGEFRAFNAGFSTIPDPAYKRGHATVTWNVKRTYRFAPEDARGKYHPSTFWPRIFGSAWSDDYIAPVDATPSSRPTEKESSAVHLHLSPSPSSAPSLYVLNYYGSRCHIEEVAYVTHTDEKNGSKKTTSSWDVIRAWDVQQP